MPMLERAAPSLEHCSIPRILNSSANKPRRARRRLHTTFWHHGAAEIELSNAWQLLMDGVSRPALPKDVESSRYSMTASAFLLDFLYPNGALTFLRKLSPAVFDRAEIPSSSPTALAARLYSSTARPPGLPRLSSTRDREEASTEDVNAPLPDEQLGAPSQQAISEPSRDGLEHVGQEGDSLPASTESNERMRDLLVGQGDIPLGRVWQMYVTLGDGADTALRTAVVARLAKSTTAADAQRIKEVFSSIGREDWTKETVVEVVKAKLVLRETTEALTLFKDALDSHGFTDSLDRILAYAVSNSAWSLFLESWAYYLSGSGRPAIVMGGLTELEAVPGSLDRLLELWNGIHPTPSVESSERTKLLDSLFELLSPSILGSLSLSAALFYLERRKSHNLYEKYIGFCVSQGRKHNAAAVYAKFRKLEGVRMPVSLLQTMVRIFSPGDVHGMDLVLEDWRATHTHLNPFGYTRFLKLYANRGDIRATSTLWEEYRKYYPTYFGPSSTRGDTFTFLLQAHAVRGDLSAVHRVFDEISEKYGCTPNTTCWNILLSAHIRVDDLDGAIDVFNRLCRDQWPDDYTFGTLMAAMGSRGDLDYVLDLHQMALKAGVTPNADMAAGLVAAYCENDRPAEAQKICLDFTAKQRSLASCTPVWNKLLYYHSMRRDLTAVNAILEEMAELTIPYDSATHESLIWTLVLCRQSHHAYRLIKLGLEERAFHVTPQHLIVLMAGFIRTGEPHMVLKIDELMSRLDMPRSAKRTKMVISALANPERLSGSQTRGRQRRDFLQEIMRVFGVFAAGHIQAHASPETGTPLEAKSIVKAADVYARMVFVLTQFGELGNVDEMMEFYARSFPHQSDREDVRLRLLSASILADFHEGRHPRVKATWQVLLRRIKMKGVTVAAGEDGQEPMLLPRYSSMLSDALKTMQRVYIAEKDPAGLLELVRQATAEGFRLDNRNWNYCVQNLARLKDLKGAFRLCEENLMDQWPGWMSMRHRQGLKRNLPFEQRARGSAPMHLRATSYTLTVLAGELLAIKQMAPWAPGAARLCEDLSDKCPRTTQAVENMVRQDNQLESEVFLRNAGRWEAQQPSPAHEAEKRAVVHDWDRYLAPEEYQVAALLDEHASPTSAESLTTAATESSADQQEQKSV